MAVTGTTLGGTTHSNSGTSQTHTASATTPTGAWMVVGVGLFGSSPSGVTAPGGTAMAKLSTLADASGYSLTLWGVYATSGFTAGTITVTWSVSQSFGCNIVAGYVTGLVTSSPVDGTPTGFIHTSSLTAAWDTGNVTTTVANDGLIGLGFSDGGPTGSTPSGSNSELADVHDSTNDWDLVMEFQEVTSTGTYSVTGTFSASPSFGEAALIVALAGSGGGGGGGATVPDLVMPPMR